MQGSKVPPKLNLPLPQGRQFLPPVPGAQPGERIEKRLRARGRGRRGRRGGGARGAGRNGSGWARGGPLLCIRWPAVDGMLRLAAPARVSTVPGRAGGAHLPSPLAAQASASSAATASSGAAAAAGRARAGVMVRDLRGVAWPG